MKIVQRWFFADWRKRVWIKFAWSLVALAGFIVGEVALASQAIDDPLVGDDLLLALFFFVCLAVWVAGLGVINFVVWLGERREDQRLIDALEAERGRKPRRL
jgi:uncharacterized membrane protein HdeD (DUF308 family)